MAKAPTRAERYAAAVEMGLNEDQIAVLLGPEQTAETAVRGNSGEDATKFGITSILKVFANGSERTKMGLRTAKAHVALIEQLQARYAELPDAEEFTPFALKG